LAVSSDRFAWARAFGDIAGIAMNVRLRNPFCALAIGLCTAARADLVGDWNEKVMSAGVQARQPPYVQARSAAIVHVAMFEAVNAIEPRYRSYKVLMPASPGASLEAAVAAAAHVAMTRLYPDQAQGTDAFYVTSTAAIPEGASKAEGIRIGEYVAGEIVAIRAADGADAPSRYRPSTTPGTYVPTAIPVGTSWGSVTPFALRSPSQFRPRPPYSLESPEWVRDYNETRRMGGTVGSARTAEQSEVARFWELPGSPLHNPVLRQLAARAKLDLLDNARLHALYAIAVADSNIAVFDAKYTYNFWRPVTAIRNGGIAVGDGDDTWESFIPTPPHPEFPCAHCIQAGAGAGVLEAFFGDRVAFTLTSSTAPGVTRTFASLSDFVRESIDARVYGGVHYRTSGEVGAAMGRGIAEFTVRTQLTPLRRTRP